MVWPVNTIIGTESMCAVMMPVTVFVAPGPIEGTEGMRRLAPADEGFHRRFRASIPLGRLGTAEEIGQVAVFLASPLASYVTGTLLVADGGQNLPGSGLLTHLIRQAMAGGA